MSTQTARHPSDQTLQEYGLGKLGDFLAESVVAHLESCPECRRRVDEISSAGLLDPLRAVKCPATPSDPVVSSTGGPSTLGGELRADTLPPGLAGHPVYEVVRELGRGGMGAVYLARNKLMGRDEALKVVGGHLASRPGMIERFFAEIRNAAKLLHPNIVTAYTALRIGEDLVLAMEYVDGLDLTRVVRTRGPLPVAHACYYAHQAAMGLQCAHERGLVHRDIKPGNLMLTRQGNKPVVKILDFGLAKARREESPAAALTRTGQVLGTPAYMAPEQMGDPRRADIRADIYSLGCTLYFLLTGKPPFEGKDVHDVLQAHHSMEAAPLNLARPDVPAPLAVIVATMMAKEPERRFQTPRDVSQALLPFIKKEAAAPAGPVSMAPGGFQLSQGTGWPAEPPPVTTRPAVAAPAAAAPAPAREPSPGPTASGSEWALPIRIEPDEDLTTEVQTLRAARSTPAWLWPAAAGVFVLLGLAVALGMSLERNRTPAVPAPARPTEARDEPQRTQVPDPPRPTEARPSLASRTNESAGARPEPATPTEKDSPGKPAPHIDPTPPAQRATDVARNDIPRRPDSLDKARQPEAPPAGKESPGATAANTRRSAAEAPEKPDDGPPAEAGTPEAVLARRGLQKFGTFYVIPREFEVAATWQGLVPNYTLMDTARAELVQAMEIAAYAQQLNDYLVNLQVQLTDLNMLLGRANRQERALIQNQIGAVNAEIVGTQGEIAKVRTRLVSPARRQELHNVFMLRRQEFLDKSKALRPILDKMMEEYAALKADSEVSGALKAIKERKKLNAALGPSTKLRNRMLQLKRAEEEVSLNPDAYRSKKKKTRLEGRDAKSK